MNHTFTFAPGQLRARRPNLFQQHADFGALLDGCWIAPGGSGTVALLAAHAPLPRLVRRTLAKDGRWLLVVQDDPAAPRYSTAAGPEAFHAPALAWALATAKRVVLWSGGGQAPEARDQVSGWLRAGEPTMIVATQAVQASAWLHHIEDAIGRLPDLVVSPRSTERQQ